MRHWIHWYEYTVCQISNSCLPHCTQLVFRQIFGEKLEMLSHICATDFRSYNGRWRPQGQRRRPSFPGPLYGSPTTPDGSGPGGPELWLLLGDSGHRLNRLNNIMSNVTAFRIWHPTNFFVLFRQPQSKKLSVFSSSPPWYHCALSTNQAFR